MPPLRTTGLTGFVGSDLLPRDARCTLYSDGLFRMKGSRVVLDAGDDPGDWTFWTSDHVMNVASDDLDGFQILKGRVSHARMAESTHKWKTSWTLAGLIAHRTSKGEMHPLASELVRQLRSESPLEAIRAAYASYRQLMSGEGSVEPIPEDALEVRSEA